MRKVIVLIMSHLMTEITMIIIIVIIEHNDNEPEITDTAAQPPRPTPQLRRSIREKTKPNYYGREQANLSLLTEPHNFQEADSSPDQSKWRNAMKTEIKSLKDNQVWDLVELPPGRKTVGSKWVYKQKVGEDGSVERYKARLVAQGYTQRYGTDYDETFCLVVRAESL